MTIKDNDSVDEVQRLNAFIRIFVFVQFFFLAGFAYWTTYGNGKDYPLGLLIQIFFGSILLALIISWAISRLVHAAAAHAGGQLTNAIMGIRSCRTIREQLAGELERIKYFCRKKSWPNALSIIEDVLERDPDCPEALALKARILGDGLGNPDASRIVIRQLLKIAPNDDPHRRWASEYYRNLNTLPGDERSGRDSDTNS